MTKMICSSANECICLAQCLHREEHDEIGSCKLGCHNNRSGGTVYCRIVTNFHCSVHGDYSSYAHTSRGCPACIAAGVTVDVDTGGSKSTPAMPWDRALGVGTCTIKIFDEPFHATGEEDPNGLTPSDPGAKLDEGKILAGILSDFSFALKAVAEVGTFGAKKYSRGGWQAVENGEERYYDAMWRHLLAERHEDIDPDSGLLHEAHRAWNVLAKLELRLRREKK